MKHLIFLFAFMMTANSLLGNTYYVSNDNGSDANPGTRNQPFKTISKGAETAQPGDTVFVLEGVYRERVAPPRGGTARLPVVYMAEPDKQVFIKGSDVYDKPWNAYKDRAFYADLNQMHFTDDYYWDDANPFKVMSAGNPFGTTGKHTLGQVFVEGEPYAQKESLAALDGQPGCWWYDRPNNRVCVHFKPDHSTSNLVEITTRRRIFAPHTMGLGYIHVIGFIMEHCGNQFPVYGQKETAQAGALGLRGGQYWLVKHNIIRYAAGIGLDCGTERDNRRGENEYSERFEQPPGAGPRPDGSIIEENYLLNNGCIGIAGIGNTRLIVRGNVVMYNNTQRHNLSEEGGIKLHQCNRGLVDGNYIAGNYTYGLWLDGLYGGSGTRVTRNLIVYNSKGIKVEIGDYDFGALLVDRNVLMNNRENQYYSHDASGVLVVNNLMAGSRQSDFGQGVYVQQVSDRSTSNSRKNAFYNNIICSNDYAYDILYPSGRGGGEQRFLGNLYNDATGRAMCINNMTNRYNQLEMSVAQFRQKVSEDVGKALPNEAFRNPTSASNIRACLTLEEWKTFWSKYTTHNDHDAEVMPDLSATYDSAAMTVRLHVPAIPAKRDNSRWDSPYKTTYPLTEETSYPGPFDEIRTGANAYRPFEGLPPVKSDELPPIPNRPVDPEADDEVYLLKEHFDGMKLGGDVIGYTQGIDLDISRTPWDVATDPGKNSFPANPVYKSCPQATLGPNLFDANLSESYRILRNFTGDWAGGFVYEQPGYVTFGNSGSSGWLTTPPLSGISAATADVKASIKIARSASSNAGTSVTVSVSGGGAIVTGQGESASARTFPIGANNTWEEKEFVITGATSSTKVRFAPTVTTGSYRNFSLDDIVITLHDYSDNPNRNINIPSYDADAKNTANISVYPNPVGDNLYFRSKEIVRRIDVFNLQGVAVRSESHLSGSHLSLTGLLPGMYIVCFTTQHNETVCMKVNKI